jgi:hypothetical protein
MSQPQLIPVAGLRSEVYSTEYLAAYRQNVTVPPGWHSFINRTGAMAALLTEDSALTDALQQQLHWRTLGRDAGFILMQAP